MADSLRDQLLKAGFKSEEKKPASGQSRSKKAARNKRNKPATQAARKSNAAPGKSFHKASTKVSAAADKKAADQKAIETRKRVKAEIKLLIEPASIKNYAGEIPYNFVLGNKVRQLFVNKAAQEKLASGETVITRLNGNTHVIPAELASSILKLNPDWAIVDNTQDDKSTDQSRDDYGDYEVPDDLTW